MITANTCEELRTVVAAWKHKGKRIAFVPTMGNLHAGHLALVDHARELAERVVVSIFVNPAQFGPGEDFDRYPRTEEADTRWLVKQGADLLFLPSVEEIYGDNPDPVRVSVPGLSEILCGESRPGHFDGVATVMTRLFNIVQPDIAVFGQKDFQQIILIRRMVDDLAIPVQIAALPTCREQDGLAMSSRNQYLSGKERKIAVFLHTRLKAAVEAAKKPGASFKKINSDVNNHLIVYGFKPEYVEIRRQSDLEMPGQDDKSLVILAAARLGITRLIDNIPFELE